MTFQGTIRSNKFMRAHQPDIYEELNVDEKQKDTDANTALEGRNVSKYTAPILRTITITIAKPTNTRTGVKVPI